MWEDRLEGGGVRVWSDVVEVEQGMDQISGIVAVERGWYYLHPMSWYYLHPMSWYYLHPMLWCYLHPMSW